MIAEPLSRVLEATGYLSNGKPAAPQCGVRLMPGRRTEVLARAFDLPPSSRKRGGGATPICLNGEAAPPT